jgi:UDP-glucuronate decarboxylase
LFLKSDVYDIIINLACVASPPLYQNEPVFTMDTCYIGTKRLLELMAKNTIFLQASTSEIYGDSLNDIQYELDRGNVNCYGPRACYDEGKRIAETLCYEWAKKGYNTKIVRIFNTYGPHMSLNDGRLIPNLLSQAFKNEPFTIYGDGNQTRSFQYIDDLVDGIISLLESNINTPVNIGNPEEITVNELVEIIKTELNLPEYYPIEYKKLPVDDPTHRKPGITMARVLLNYEPKVKIKQGIQKLISWIKTTNTII